MCKRCLDYGFPTVMGRGLFGEFKNFVNPPFLIVTMPDLWEMFRHEFEGADYKLYLTDSIEMADLDRDAAALTDIKAVIGLGGGQALDVAKWFAWRRNLPLFQAPTALSVNAVYSHRSGVRDGGKVPVKTRRDVGVFVDNFQRGLVRYAADPRQQHGNECPHRRVQRSSRPRLFLVKVRHALKGRVNLCGRRWRACRLGR
jgi:hypothetical protein